MKPQIKECKPFGKGGSHIVMSMNDISKRFLVLPESSKYILKRILKQYNESLEEVTNPLLSKFLSKKEFETIKEIYEKKIKDKKWGFGGAMYDKFIRSSYGDLDKFRLSDIGIILNEIEGYLPKKLKEKLLSEFYKK